jgi:hypothetical protein
MINLLIILIIIAAVSLLGNILMTIQARMTSARARVRGAKDNSARLHARLQRGKRDGENVAKEMEEQARSIAALRQTLQDAQARLAEAQSRRRPQLLIFSDRRTGLDKEWLVTVVNTQIGDVEASHPLAAEWAQGREYLVWAETDRDAHDRVQRRFGARPGYSVKSVVAVKEDLLSPRPAVAAG